MTSHPSFSTAYEANHSHVGTPSTASLDGNEATTAREFGLPSLVIAVTFGLALMFAVGLAQSPTLHNAAHDSRHAMGFPCH